MRVLKFMKKINFPPRSSQVYSFFSKLQRHTHQPKWFVDSVGIDSFRCVRLSIRDESMKISMRYLYIFILDIPCFSLVEAITFMIGHLFLLSRFFFILQSPQFFSALSLASLKFFFFIIILVLFTPSSNKSNN